MDDARLIHLNDTLREVASREISIENLNDIAAWFAGTVEEVRSHTDEVCALFDEACNNGVTDRWIEAHDHRDSSMHWNWTIAAHQRAKQMGITLTDPLGIHPAFRCAPSSITSPLENAHNITSESLDDDVCGCLATVYGEQARYVIHHEGQPVAAIVPLLDWEMLKDLQLETDPCRWIEWIQTIRERLGWPPATSDE